MQDRELFLAKAQEFELLASQRTDEATREHWLRLASNYRELARRNVLAKAIESIADESQP